MSGAIDQGKFSRIKTEYVSSVLRETAILIREREQGVVSEWSLFKTGTLGRSLTDNGNVNTLESGAALEQSNLIYMRFLDMRRKNKEGKKAKRQGFQIYNRVTYGIIFNRTLPAIQYGLTDVIRNEVMEMLQDSFEGDADIAAVFTKALRMGIFNTSFQVSQ